MMGEWIAMRDRLPERGQFIEMLDAMFNEVWRGVVNWPPEHTDGDYTHWRFA